MKVKLHIVTLICVNAGSVKKVGEISHELMEVSGKEKPKHWLCRKKDPTFGLWREVMRTEVEIDAPEMDEKELTDLQIESLVAERSELEANFYIAKKRIDDRIGKLRAIEYKPT
ncbi:hypothetical protein [Pectobacterium carotovorum]|uniref:hypothetical protein n=1 Tax=Pectobacterium carotovorum TaxID=554 RepID=UPI000D7262B1|nr:hypothetical protein [Pectobacterium carotovorum]PXB01159.1 hypothetical protein DMB41_16320 [Pectobacterium carotovorum subsp. carotovorum]